MISFINEQFRKVGGLKDALIEHMERRIVTSAAENTLFRPHQINSDNWHQNPELRRLDLPAQSSRAFRTDHDRIEFIRYLLRLNEHPPQAWEDLVRETTSHYVADYQPTARAELQNGFHGFVQAFRSSGQLSQAYFLQTYLGRGGIDYGNPESLQELQRIILGANSHHEVFRKIFVAYIDALPAGEKNVVLSYILSSILNDPAAREGASVRRILEAMGPFGIKVGQFLRSSGLVSGPVQRSLDDFFDNALPPTQDRIYDDARRVFWSDLRRVRRFRGLVGSGSINYAGRWALEDSNSAGQEEDIVARVQRREAVGQVANENENWQIALETLARDSNAQVVHLAQTLEEAWTSTMRTLSEDGPEFNMSHERRIYPRIRQSYETVGHDPRSGLRIVVVGPRTDLQQNVPEVLQNQVSLLNIVHNTRFSDLTRELQAQVGRQTVEAELRALIVNGIFDPDSHPGNWLIDLEHGHLGRIDYAQGIEIPPVRLAMYKTIIESLFVVSPRADDIATLNRDLHEIFNLPPHHSRIMAYQEAIGPAELVNTIRRFLNFRIPWSSYLTSLRQPEIRRMMARYMRARASQWFTTATGRFRTNRLAAPATAPGSDIQIGTRPTGDGVSCLMRLFNKVLEDLRQGRR